MCSDAKVAIVVCADPLSPRTPDPAFLDDADAAAAIGMRRLLIDHDDAERGDVRRALRRAETWWRRR